MAASDSQLAAGRRLASDLRSIRRKRGIDLKEVLDATRLADDVIEQLEEDALVNHPAFNRVYLKSLFGAYGEALGINREDMRAALDEVFDGAYVGALASAYLGRMVDEADVDAIFSATTEVEGEVRDAALEAESESPTEEVASPESESESESESEADEEEPSNELSDESDYENGKPVGVIDAHSSGNEASLADKSNQTRPPHESEGVWTGLADKKPVLLPNMSGTALLVIAGIAFVSLLWFAVSTVMNLSSDDEPVVVPPDTSTVEETFQPERIVLPDSIDIAVIAFTEPLDPIRVTIDRDLRKPYWVELMDTHRVAVTERILLEREAAHTRVLFDGFAIPNHWLLQDDPVEITRGQVQSWLDSLVTAGVTPQRESPTVSAANELP